MNQKDEIAFEILRSIRKILRKVSEYSRHLSREVGLTVPQLLCLRTIGQQQSQSGEATVVSISQAVQLTPATVSRILDRLEKQALVARERRSTDRRKVSVTLTDAGARLFEDLPRPLHDEFLDRLQKLAKADRLALLDALSRIVDLMEAGDVDASPMLVSGVDVKRSGAD